jgi:hypothetical protein
MGHGIHRTRKRQHRALPTCNRPASGKPILNPSCFTPLFFCMPERGFLIAHVPNHFNIAQAPQPQPSREPYGVSEYY